MSIINPARTLDLLARRGVVSHDESRSLQSAHPAILSEAMKTVESTPALTETLSLLVAEIERRTAEQAQETEALRRIPRYASAPEVTGTFVRQFWSAGDYLTEIARDEFTVPLPYLVANRERLEDVEDFGDSDWLAFDLGLAAGHDGPFDITDIEDSLSAWMEATKVTD